MPQTSQSRANPLTGFLFCTTLGLLAIAGLSEIGSKYYEEQAIMIPTSPKSEVRADYQRYSSELAEMRNYSGVAGLGGLAISVLGAAIGRKRD